MLVADKCDHCGATGWADHWDMKSCNECADRVCKDCATHWEEEDSGTVCKTCVQAMLT